MHIPGFVLRACANLLAAFSQTDIVSLSLASAITSFSREDAALTHLGETHLSSAFLKTHCYFHACTFSILRINKTLCIDLSEDLRLLD